MSRTIGTPELTTGFSEIRFALFCVVFIVSSILFVFGVDVGSRLKDFSHNAGTQFGLDRHVKHGVLVMTMVFEFKMAL